MNWQTAAKFLFYSIITFVLLASSCPKDPPTTPCNPSPTNGASNRAITTNLSWECGNSQENSAVTYDIYFGVDSTPDYSEYTGDTDHKSWSLSTLDYGTHYYWKVIASDQYGSSESPVWSFTTISEPNCIVSVTSPNGGESWAEGSAHTISWNSSNCSGNVSINLYRNGSYCSTIASSTPDNGSYVWQVEQCNGNETGYKIRVTNLASGDYDESNSNFSIPGGPCTITVTSPNGGESWPEGSSRTISWNSSNCSGNVSIKLYHVGSLCSTIASSTPDDGIYVWEVEPCNDFSINYKVRVTNLASGNFDESDSYFNIPGDCIITVTDPNGGESWPEGTSHAIEWDTYGSCGSNVWIELYKGSSSLCTIDGNYPNTGYYLWTVDDCGGGSDSDYRVRVTILPFGPDDYSGYFTIPGDCEIDVTNPNGDPPPWYEGNVEWIYWDSQDTSGNVKLELYHDDQFLCTIDPSIVDDGSHPWTVDLCGHTSSWLYQIKISDVNNATCYGFSNYFGMDFPDECDIDVTMPNGDPPPWYEGNVEWIYWDSQDTSGNVKLELYHDDQFLCTIDPSIVDDGSHPWTVDLCGHTSSWLYQIKISDVNNATCYGFSNYFGMDFP